MRPVSGEPNCASGADGFFKILSLTQKQKRSSIQQRETEGQQIEEAVHDQYAELKMKHSKAKDTHQAYQSKVILQMKIFILAAYDQHVYVTC